MLSCLINLSLVGNRQRKILAQYSRTGWMDQSVSSLNTAQIKRAVEIAIACSFLLVLPSCIPALRNPKPGPGLPESFDLRKADPQSDLPAAFDHADSPENSARLKIEEFYNDPLL